MKHRVFIFSAFFFYIILMTGFMIYEGVGIAPDRYAFVLLLASLLVKRARPFILDWIPFLFILLSYDFLRGFADKLGSRVHFEEIIKADKFLFNDTVPTIYLQQHFFNPNSLNWYDFFATLFYFLHWALPLSFGFFLWMTSKKYFREFVTGILLLSYAGWATYVIYPAAPPWLASQKGYLPYVYKIQDFTTQAFPDKLHLPSIYHQFNANEVAAIPSMHAAYPFLVLLFALSYFRLKALLFLPYVLGVWISVVYLGEHYVIDVIIGAIYALIFFIVAKYALHHVKFQTWLKKTAGKLWV